MSHSHCKELHLFPLHPCNPIILETKRQGHNRGWEREDKGRCGRGHRHGGMEIETVYEIIIQ